jgi:RNA polymerase sigma-70 factor, ECF subfamily
VAVLPEGWASSFDPHLDAHRGVCAVAPPDLVEDGDSMERALVGRALAKDEGALRAIYTQHAPCIHRFLRDLLGDEALACDATQETFARAFRRLDTLRAIDRIAPWLFGIARNVCLEQRKARRRHGRWSGPAAPRAEVEPDTGEDADAITPEVMLLGREAARVVGETLSRMSEDRRTVLLLRIDHALAYDDIAELMGWSLAKVKVEIHRARLELRAQLAKYQGGEP